MALLNLGLGLRWPFLDDISDGKSGIGWFEVITENVMNRTTPFFHELLKVREFAEVSVHGVSLSLGSQDADPRYLRDLKHVVDTVQPKFVSDHVCWSRSNGQYFPDLLPVGFTRQNAWIIADRIQQVQDYLGRRILVENISQYLSFKNSEMSEGEFIREIAERADCLLLLDINNIYVNEANLGYPWRKFLSHIPFERVKQLHIAGHANDDGFLIDTHGEPVNDEVYEILSHVQSQHGDIPTLLERDSNIPAFGELVLELEKIRAIKDASSVTGTAVVY